MAYTQRSKDSRYVFDHRTPKNDLGIAHLRFEDIEAIDSTGYQFHGLKPCP